MRMLRTIILDILIFILVNVLCFSMLCPSIINSAIQNDEITQEMTNKVMTVINQYTYRLPDITIKKIQADISQSQSMTALTSKYSQAIIKQMATGEENKEDMTPYINNLAQECFEIVEKDTDITLPSILKTSLTKLISSGLVSQGIDQYVDDYISKQSPKRLKMIQIFYQLTLDSNRMIMGVILIVLCLIQLIVDKLYGLTALGVTGVLSGLCVSYIMPLAISEGASSYLNRTVIFDPSILRTPGMMICGISVVVVIIAQLIMRKTARKVI